MMGQQFGDPRGDGLRVVADQRCRSWSRRAGRQCGQPAGPFPAGLPVSESVSTQSCTSFGAVQDGDLGHQPAPEGPGRLPGPGHAEHAPLGKRHVTGASGISRTPAGGARPGSGPAARPRTAGPRCPAGAAGSRGRCGAAPTAAGAARTRSSAPRRGRGVGGHPPLPLGVQRVAAASCSIRALCSRYSACWRARDRRPCRVGDVVPDHHHRAHHAHGQHVDLVQEKRHARRP